MNWLVTLVLLTPNSDLDAAISAEWEYQLQQSPELATTVGDGRYNDKLTDLSPEAIAKRKAHSSEMLGVVKAIDRTKLDAKRQLDYDVLGYDLETQVQLAKFPNDFIQGTPMWGIHSAMADIATTQPRATPKDVDDFIARVGAAPKQIEQAIALLRQGLAQGITPPQANMKVMPGLVRNQTPKDPTQSPVYLQYFAKLENEHDRQRGLEVIKEKLYPAYTALADFYEREYIPKSRTTLGWSQVPDGAAWYRAYIRQHTTTDMDPESIHQLGQHEVARIKAEMEKLKTELKFTKDLPALFAFMRSDKRFFYTDKEQLVSGYRDIAKRIDEQLPKQFGKLPRLTYGVEPVPSYNERVAPTAYYMIGSAAAGRPGVFYCNTYDLKSRPKWEMETLTQHEAVPGHHLQIALAEEADAPPYRKYYLANAYAEGWGLYSESLGKAFGLYTDPYARFGQLTYEMWRAVRLVIDTGIHMKGWTRQQAIDFFKANTGKAQHDIEVEVDRYITWPAQALSYKIGQLKISGLRHEAEQALGARFDPRAFHDAVLDDGALPLDVLEVRIRTWIKGMSSR